MMYTQKCRNRKSQAPCAERSDNIKPYGDIIYHSVRAGPRMTKRLRNLVQHKTWRNMHTCISPPSNLPKPLIGGIIWKTQTFVDESRDVGTTNLYNTLGQLVLL